MPGVRRAEVLVAAHHAAASARDVDAVDPAVGEMVAALADKLDVALTNPRQAVLGALYGWLPPRWRPHAGLAPRALILTSPAQWWVARCFPRATLVYYAVDNYAVGYGWPAARVYAWERRIVSRCAVVVVVSAALAAEMARRHRLPAARLVVSPNAVPAALIPAQPLPPRRRLPALAGVLGRVSSRLRLTWIRQAVEALPWLHWRFAGDVEEAELVAADREPLAWLQRHPRCQFLGRLPYRELARQAAEVDVGVMPFSERSINPWGSPMRLFVHLAAGRPLLGTPGCAQVADFAPLVTLCGDASELIARLEALRRCDFDDGLQTARLATARAHTWDHRAATMAALLARTVPRATEP
ncbi:MAG: hypothetical protein SF182_19020 [Deltaproteobacteria bacterium]|nr:hypothetical protein [Deltaproteobacteria bacterium]